MKFIDLKQHLKTQNILPCYIIFGDDEQVLLFAENNFKSVIEPAFADFNIVSFDVKECEPQKVVDACNTLPLMAQKKLVILKDESKENAKSEESTKQKGNSITTLIANYLKSPNSTTILLIKTQENSSLYTKLKTVATFVDCNRLDTLTLKKYILSETKKKNVEILDNEILKLIDVCGSNLGTIITELQKLMSVCSNNKITSEDIENNCTKNLEYSVFELSEALSNKNSERALNILNDMLQNPKNQMTILPLISSHFRRLFMVATSSESSSQKGALLGVKEYAINRSEALAKKFSKKKLMDITKLINESEFLVKSGNAGLVDTLYHIVLYILNN